MTLKKGYFKLSFKITLMVVLMVVLCSAAVGVVVFRNFADDVLLLKGMTAQTAADTLAAALDPEAVKKLDETETEDAYYGRLKEILDAAGERTTFNFLYILTLADNAAAFKVICGQDGSGTFRLPLGYKDPVEIWNEAALRCFTSRTHTYSAPYNAEGFGDLMSGYAPLLVADGSVAAIVGLDIPLADVMADMASMKTSLTLIVLAFVVLFGAVSVVIVRLRVGKPITELSGLSKNIVAGNLDSDVDIRARDEIGVLADDLLEVKTILGNLNREMSGLVKSAADGRMRSRADAENYAGDWGALLRELNRLLDTLDVPANYAAGIQRNLLPKDGVFTKAFADHAVVWQPRDIVGGDIYWMKNFGGGSVLCVCDCTGHGTPGALLTMLVVSAFDAMVTEENHADTAQILWNLEQRLVSVFNRSAPKTARLSLIREGCDVAVIRIAENGDVAVSAANTSVFVCDGKDVRRIRGQKVYVGEGKIRSKEEIETVTVPADRGNMFAVASDGLFDQPGGAQALPFGYGAFRDILLEKRGGSCSAAAEAIWDAFEEHRGTEPRRDDVELILFRT